MSRKIIMYSIFVTILLLTQVVQSQTVKNITLNLNVGENIMNNETDYNSNQLTKMQENQIDAIYSDLDKTDSPGCILGVIQDGRFIYKKSFGMANLDYDIPITAESKFDIASVTKQFTAACIVLLVLEGKISLEDDVRKYIPELPDYGCTITIRHLLHHTSGLRDYLELMTIVGLDLFRDKEIKKIIFSQKELNFIPGEEFLYSNTGYFLLAEIISRVSGISYAQYVKDKIFTPLEMHNSFIEDKGLYRKSIAKNRVTAYKKINDVFFEYVDIVEASGGRGVVTTLNDLFLWDQNFYTGKLGGKVFIDMLTSNKAVLNDQTETGHALGLEIYNYKNLPVIGHSGWWLGFRSQMVRFPQQKTSIILLGNTDMVDISVDKVIDIVLSDEIAKLNMLTDSMIQSGECKKGQPEALMMTEKELEIFCGYYWSEEDCLSRRIYLKEGCLYYWRSENNESKLLPISQNELIIEANSADIILHFDFDSNHKTINFLTNGKCTLIFKSYEPFDCNLDYLNKFVGTYFSEELNIVYQIKNHSNKLVFFIDGEDEEDYCELNATIINRFKLGFWGYEIKIYFKENGEVSGYKISTDRAKNINFIKRY